MEQNHTPDFSDKDYWIWRAKNPPRGRPKAFTPRKIWELACEYFSRVDQKPFIHEDFIRGGTKAGDIVPLKRMRPYTWQGFKAYLCEQGYINDIDDYIGNKDGRYSEFVDTMRAIGNIIYDRKYEGAASGFFNSNLIVRDLGLVDKSQTRITPEQPLFSDEQNS